MVGPIHTPESAIHRLATQGLLVGNLANAAVLGGAILALALHAVGVNLLGGMGGIRRM